MSEFEGHIFDRAAGRDMGREPIAAADRHQIGIAQIALCLRHGIRNVDIARHPCAIAPRRIGGVRRIEIGLEHRCDLLDRAGPRKQREKAFLGGDLQGAVAARAGNSDIGTRLGQRLGNDLPVLALPDLAVPIERLGLGPRFEDDVDGFAHHVALRCRQYAAQSPAPADAKTEAGHVAAIGQVIALRGVGRDLQRMKIGQRANTRAHLDALGQRRGFADERIRRRQLIGRVIADENPVLADPGFVDAQLVGEDDLVQIFLIARLGDLIAPLAVGEKPEFHFLSFRETARRCRKPAGDPSVLLASCNRSRCAAPPSRS